MDGTIHCGEQFSCLNIFPRIEINFHIPAEKDPKGFKDTAIDIAVIFLIKQFEEHIGTHRPKAVRLSGEGIKGRVTGTSDRRTNTDRRADKRRLGDKSKAMVAARGKTKGS